VLKAKNINQEIKQITFFEYYIMYTVL